VSYRDRYCGWDLGPSSGLSNPADRVICAEGSLYAGKFRLRCSPDFPSQTRPATQGYARPFESLGLGCHVGLAEHGAIATHTNMRLGYPPTPVSKR
jgi:hypothetical protein